MTSTRNTTAAMALLAAFGLISCADGTAPGSERPGASRSASQVVERDVESPGVFSTVDRGLWDGRPSLGGVWVAHPEVNAPERVLIRNTETGNEVVGALFRRERMNPGPVFQVSGEAAEALGLLAGAPAQISVVALRTEEVRTVGGAEADEDAPDAAESAPQAQIAPEAADSPSGPETQIDLSNVEAAPAERRGFFGLLGRRDTSAASQQVTTGIETVALDDDTAAPEPSAAPSAPATTPAPSPAPSPAGAAPAQSGLSQPFIQLGIFSVEANAERARAMASVAGLSASVRTGETRGQKFWRVIVGPASTGAQRTELLNRVKDLGFADAYAVTR